MEVLRTKRLVLRHLIPDDSAFILALVNDPDWLRHIGDRGVRTIDDARAYLETGPIAMYAKHGFGLCGVERRESQTLIGICGLIKRDALDDVDLGFAFLPQFRGQGYAHEAARATLSHGYDDRQLGRIVAIVSAGNDVSIRLLRKLGMQRERSIRLAPDADEVELFVPMHSRAQTLDDLTAVHPRSHPPSEGASSQP